MDFLITNPDISFTMIKKTDLIPNNETAEVKTPTNNLIVVYKKEESNSNLPKDYQSPIPKEFPVNKWNIPPEQQGYLKINDNDLL
jgi:hypothetical protein